MKYLCKLKHLKGTNLAKVCFAFYAVVFALNLQAIEVIASKGDTFISQAMPSGEFSKSDFLAVSKDSNEKTLIYIPFEFDAQHIGIQPTRDRINDVVLTLFVKSFPSIPKSNAIASNGTPDTSTSLTTDSPEKSAKKLEENLNDKINSLEDTIVRIEVFAVIDDETLEPNSKNYRISWDGKNDSPAPKHNTVDDKLEEGGITKLGTIEIDISKDDYDDGDRVEFKSDELTDFLAFCYGITYERGENPKFRSSLEKIRNATFILRQESGPSAIFFYSSDSLGEYSDKEQSGDETKEQKQKDADKYTTANILPRDIKQQEKLIEEKNKKEIKEAEKVIAKKVSSDFETVQLSLGSDILAEIIKKENTKRNSLENEQEKKGNQPDNDKQKPDLRPRINFEFRSDPEKE